MTLSRKTAAVSIILLILAAAVVYGAYYLSSDAFRYRGLVTSDDTEIDEGQRLYFEQQVATAQGALAAQKAEMDINDVDWDLYLSIAWNASAMGDLVTAREILEEYFTLHQTNPAAYSLYGTILSRMEDKQKAEDALRRSADLQPSEEAYRKLIAAVRDNSENGDRDQEIKDLLEEGVDKVGQTSWFMVALAEWYLGHNDCDQALDHYQVAEALLPDNEAIAADIAAAREQCRNAE